MTNKEERRLKEGLTAPKIDLIKIVDALELSIKPRDGDFDLIEEVDFTWTVEAFEPYSLQL